MNKLRLRTSWGEIVEFETRVESLREFLEEITKHQDPWVVIGDRSIRASHIVDAFIERVQEDDNE